jgi:hypothetical protein
MVGGENHSSKKIPWSLTVRVRVPPRARIITVGSISILLMKQINFYQYDNHTYNKIKIIANKPPPFL